MGDLRKWQESLGQLPSALYLKISVNQKGAVCLGDDKTLNVEETKILTRSLESLIPWRKGPFSICGIEIDSEWRSDLKWNRLQKSYSVFIQQKRAGYRIWVMVTTCGE